MFKYNCPQCNFIMGFNTADGVLTCSKCGSSLPITEAILPEYGSAKNSTYDSNLANSNIDEFYGNFESYNNPVTQGTPTEYIPFEVSENSAKTAFNKWCKRMLFIPASFKKSFQKNGLKKCYIPVWLVKQVGQGKLNSVCTKTNESLTGKNRFTQTDYYNISRKVKTKFDYLLLQTSDEIDNDSLHRLAPYNISKLNTITDECDISKYTVDNARIIKSSFDISDIIDMVANYNPKEDVKTALYSTVNTFDSMNNTELNIDIANESVKCILIPVWMFSYRANDYNHTFYMNGQTGKVSGMPPIDIKKIASLILAGGLSLFAVINLILYITGIILI